MKLFLRYATVLLALFKAEAGPSSRMIDIECSDFNCNAVNTGELDCAFEKPERPDVTGLTQDQISELKTEFRAKKEERRQEMIKCVCCDDMSLEDILAAKGDGGGSRPFGGGGSGRPSMGGGGGSGRPGMGEDVGGDGSGRPGMGEDGRDSSGRPREGVNIQDSGDDSSSGDDGSSGDEGGSSLSVEGTNIQDMLGEKCDVFDCQTVKAETVDCTHFDSMNTNTRGRRRKNRLYCGCCRD